MKKIRLRNFTKEIFCFQSKKCKIALLMELTLCIVGAVFCFCIGWIPGAISFITMTLVYSWLIKQYRVMRAYSSNS